MSISAQAPYIWLWWIILRIESIWVAAFSLENPTSDGDFRGALALDALTLEAAADQIAICLDTMSEVSAASSAKLQIEFFA